MPDAILKSIATAVPPYEIYQTEVEQFARRLFASRPKTFERLAGAYANAGIDKRYSCVPLEWYEQPHGWKDRTKLFVESALDLLTDAAQQAIENAGLVTTDIDGIVTVSSTGLAVPSLDALLMERMPFRRDVHRLPIFGLGCGGGVLGLSRAAALAQAQPGSRWLFLVVELCGITFRGADLSKSNIIATALFGDGAAAAVVQVDTAGKRLACWGEHCWPDSLDIMGWNIEEDGFGVQFSRDIPQLVRSQMRKAADRFLEKSSLPFTRLDHFIFHPGGAKVLSALEKAFDIPTPGLELARDVLRDYGNMSAATVLFVLERTLAQQPDGVNLMGALGPGFTAGFLVMDDQ
ncbi:MAG: 3-oxoacyl-[acyl-carrier-protein] synthase III C-terminal domain-containing protein [Pseudomonadota bacterium]|nr:3-oxoacyl-[acyl-carrier-protein] synthase III C-terminal domain-containing protein [Pseudomonadota bacterium]